MASKIKMRLKIAFAVRLKNSQINYILPCNKSDTSNFLLEFYKRSIKYKKDYFHLPKSSMIYNNRHDITEK